MTDKATVQPIDVRADHGVPREPLLEMVVRRVRLYFLGEAPTFWVAMVPAILLSALLYTRSLTTNFIFDEQEALLANPYVNGKSLRFIDVIHRDFWGLPAERSVGSYRPLPDVVWRILASGLRAAHDAITRMAHLQSTFSLYPWVFHWFNVVLHATNGAILVMLVYRVTRQRGVSWSAGMIFVASAVLTEAVSGVVGTADVLGGLGALLALAALALPMWAMPVGVFAAMLLGLFSKESAIVCVPLVPLAALWLAPFTHPARPLRWARSVASLVAAVAAFVLYVECRKRWFQSPTPAELLTPLAPDAGSMSRLFRSFLLWFHQPALPKDPLNNPLVSADAPHRIAGALRVYFRALVQLVFPKTLSGDYSFPQEPVPDEIVFPESVLGGMAMVLPPLVAAGAWARALVLERRASRLAAAAPSRSAPPPSNDAEPSPEGGLHTAAARSALVGLGLVWIVVSYFPHSNLVVLLPTVRAERFLYFPAMGSSVILAIVFAWAYGRSRDAARRNATVVLFALFFTFQCVRARMHALDYADDLAFWGATKDAVPRSAKAHLNYSVMWGARGHLETRLVENRIAVELAPKWPMAHIYLGDTLCRLHRAEEAWPHYADGFKIAENEPNLIALALQCLWDEKAIEVHARELTSLANEHPGSWLDYLAKDIVENGEEHKGVDPKYRPRGYNEGPKE